MKPYKVEMPSRKILMNTSKDALLKALKKRPLVFDGAYDHNLVQFFSIANNPAFRDLPSLSCPDLVKKMHRDYAEAGADVLQTFSWGCHPSAYENDINTDTLMKAAQRSVELAREVADTYSAQGQRRWVAGIVPSGANLLFLGKTTVEEVQSIAFSISRALIEGGADILVLALQNSLSDAKVALAGVQKACAEANSKLPIFLSFDLNPGGLLSGEDLEHVFSECESMMIFSIGVYLTTHLEKLPEASFHSNIREKKKHVFSDAGYTEMRNGIVTHSLDPEAYSEAAADQAKRIGLSFVGGGWGLTPEHIRWLRLELDKRFQ
jgi:5-methyltetrahydrofolate--homocysteine methyltransferase